MIYDKEIRTFHSYRKEVLDIVRNEFKEECGCEFDQNISFDQLPFLREWSIQKKWQLLDGLSRTISACELEIQSLAFLVRHETMQDDHLDFSQPWPVDGFG